MFDRFDSLSPLDSRYWDETAAKYLSENAFTRYKLKVELALVSVLRDRGVCDDEVLSEVAAACEQITTAEVYEEEDRIKHDIRALVNCIQKRVSDKAKPFVHMTATSYDIVDTANAARYQDFHFHVLGPAMLKLEKTLIDLAIREAKTLQVGRTHGQHAVPTTFGYVIAGYVSRLGGSILAVTEAARGLRGKFSGAIGAYNSSSLFFEDPETFEAEVLAELGLMPAEHATQIVPPEAMTRFVSEVSMACGIMADLADDMRHLQRTEIGEVGEEFGADQVGSSTMPQKRNPINFENAKSLWKIIVSRLPLAYMDQLSEHQRDLTNSASGRTFAEVFAYAAAIVKRLDRTMKKLKVDTMNLKRNFNVQGGRVAAEPLYLILASLGHPDAHEAVRQVTNASYRTKTFADAVGTTEPLRPYIERMTDLQRKPLLEPESYTGVSAERAVAIAEAWKKKLKL